MPSLQLKITQSKMVRGQSFEEHRTYRTGKLAFSKMSICIKYQMIFFSFFNFLKTLKQIFFFFSFGLILLHKGSTHNLAKFKAVVQSDNLFLRNTSDQEFNVLSGVRIKISSQQHNVFKKEKTSLPAKS